MIGTIFAVICAVSLVCAIVTGNTEALSVAVVSGASKAVTLSIAMCGMMGLWNGVMNVLDGAGVCSALKIMIMPLIKLFFPRSSKNKDAVEAISASVAANMLGLGNAATPLGIRAMGKMKEAGAENDMATFAVMNTAPLSLMPSTLIALRDAGGAANPFDIVVAVWICSFVSMTASLLFSKAFCVFYKDL